MGNVAGLGYGVKQDTQEVVPGTFGHRGYSTIGGIATVMVTGEPHTPRIHQPSVQKYGTILLEDGFTQHARTVEDYLNTLDLCSTEKLLIGILESHRFTAEQELYPSVKKLAKRCGVGTRRVNQMTAHLVDLGLIIKVERFAGRSQLSNYYDLESLYEKVAAWKDTEIAAALAKEESQADTLFVPADVLEQAVQIISEEFGEPEPRKIRYNAKRLGRRYDQHPHLEWSDFADIIEKAAQQTEQRKSEPTRTGQAFTKLVPYFFSALDYHLSTVRPAPAPVQAMSPLCTTQPQKSQQSTTQPVQKSHDQPNKGPQQPAKKTGILAERARARREAEVAGQRKVRPPETLALHIKAAAMTFNDDQEKSSIQRAANIMADACLDEQTMLDLVAEARETASHCTKITKKNKHGKINRMPYFFVILEELAEKKLIER